MRSRTTFAVAPSAARLTTSLRDIGYDLQSAVADLVDNCIAAGASSVSIRFQGDGPPRVIIADDGHGMTEDEIHEALRFGSRREYANGELGRYGLGLKTASLSQARSLTVVSRKSGSSDVVTRQLSLSSVEQHDQWIINEPLPTAALDEAKDMLRDGYRTAVVWEDLDRVIPAGMVEGWARRRLVTSAQRTSTHLAMVFHRYLERSLERPIRIDVDGVAVEPWDPFVRSEAATEQMPTQTFEIESDGASGIVRLDRWVLPPRNKFSSPEAFDGAAGPMKWNRQQGIYIYRSDRLVQGGGWAGLRAIDEHTKIARCALSFETDLDSLFNINVAKMRVTLPTQLKNMLQRPVQEMCNRAEAAYRQSGLADRRKTEEGKRPDVKINAEAGLAILAAASQADELVSLRSIAKALNDNHPNLAATLGFTELLGADSR